MSDHDSTPAQSLVEIETTTDFVHQPKSLFWFGFQDGGITACRRMLSGESIEDVLPSMEMVDFSKLGSFDRAYVRAAQAPLVAEVERLQARVEALDGDLRISDDDLIARSASLDATRAELEDLREDHEHLKHEHNEDLALFNRTATKRREAEVEVERLQAESAELKKYHPEFYALKARVTDLSCREAKATQEVARLRVENEKLKATAATMQWWNKTISRIDHDEFVRAREDLAADEERTAIVKWLCLPGNRPAGIGVQWWNETFANSIKAGEHLKGDGNDE